MSIQRRFVLAFLLYFAATGLAVAIDEPDAFVLTSAQTFATSPLRHLSAEARRDSRGTDLVLVRMNLAQQLQLSQFVHEQEQRCGGYFSFEDWQAAEAYLAQEKSSVGALAPTDVNYTIDNGGTVFPWLTQVDEPHIRATIAHLSSYTNRFYLSTHGQDAATWIRDTWLALGNGRSDVSVALHTECTTCGIQPSVILTVQGTDLANEVVVVGAHLDSIRQDAGNNTQQLAPGADDDASGIATVTEVIRIALASGWKPRRTVQFMGYAAEEVGLRGSKSIALKYFNNQVNVVAVLQLDMTNFHIGVPYHFHLISDNSSGPLRAFSKSLFDTYLAPRGLARRDLSCGYACSDHVSWTNQGFPAVMASEPGSASNAFFPKLHTPDDTLAMLGGTAQASTVFALFGLAFVGELGQTHDPNLVYRNSFENLPAGIPP